MTAQGDTADAGRGDRVRGDRVRGDRVRGDRVRGDAAARLRAIAFWILAAALAVCHVLVAWQSLVVNRVWEDEAFNLTVEDVATSVATALAAEKLIFMIDGPGVQRGRGRLLRELTLSSAEAWIARTKKSKVGRGTDIERFLPAAIDACRRGVARAHLVSRHVDGALLLELFTHHGIGTMISRDSLERLRPARIDDVGAVLQLIAPLEAEGTLVKRGRERIEREIGYFTVIDHDRRLIGCAALYPFPSARAAELACLVVHPDHRNAGHGEALLLHIEARARAQKLDKLYALTTHTAHWFVENGFHEVDVSELPAERRQLYNWQRRSKVFVKSL